MRTSIIISIKKSIKKEKRKERKKRKEEKKIFTFFQILFPLFFVTFFVIPTMTGCDGEETNGKIIIDYAGDWTASIMENHSESTENGSGTREFSCTEPNRLKVTATKLDSSDGKLTLYIYENERIASADSTREPDGSITIEYDFLY